MDDRTLAELEMQLAQAVTGALVRQYCRNADA
jgi:hypothetical protein